MTKAGEPEKNDVTLSGMVGTMIAIGAPASYAYTYASESGFCSFFGIPAEFISLDLNRILLTLSILLSAAASFFMFADIVYRVVGSLNRKNPIVRSLRRLLILFGLAALFLYGYGADR